jgi:hypothetical protein
MPDSLDDLLQQKLEMLERGAPLETTLAGLPAADHELVGLVRLAAAVRKAPHPAPLQLEAETQKRLLLASIPGPRPSTSFAPGWFERLFGQSAPAPVWLAPALVGATLVTLLACLSVILGGTLLFGGFGTSQAANLKQVVGNVQIIPAGQSAWEAASDAARLSAGSRLRTGLDGAATLSFPDGSQAVLGPNTDLTLSRADASWLDGQQVVLNQNVGTVSIEVVPFKTNASQFVVYTPSGAASVHGTAFDVAVDSPERSRFMVQAGKVLVSNDQSQVYLAPGQAADVLPGQKLRAAYQFDLTGALTSRTGDIWSVAGVSFTVPSDAVISGDPQPGANIRVVGRVTEAGEWRADRISTLPGNRKPSSAFTGLVESISGNAWVVDGINLTAAPKAVTGKTPAVGKPVRVSFIVLEDGSWLATRIEALREPPVPEPTEHPGSKPKLEFVPDETEVNACQGASRASGSLLNKADDSKREALNVSLAYQVVRGAEYVDGVEINPASIARIAPGGSVPVSLNATLNAAFAKASEDAEVKVRVFVASGGGEDSSDAHWSVVYRRRCKQTGTPSTTPTATATATASATATATATATRPVTGTITATVTPKVSLTPTVSATPATATPKPSVTPTPVGSPTPGVTLTPQPTAVSCTGANPHPEGMRLAQRWGVPYAEIMGWFCQHFGFGEIDLAYGLSRQSGVPVAQIFAMRRSGLGWGEIKKRLRGIQPTPNGTPAPTQPGGGPPGGKPPKPPKPPKK